MKGASFTEIEDAIVIKYGINCDMTGTQLSRVKKIRSEILLATGKDRSEGSVTSRIGIIKRRLNPNTENEIPKQQDTDDSDIEVLRNLKKMPDRKLRLLKSYIDYILDGK